MTFVPVALEPAHPAVRWDIANALRRAGGGPESKGVYTWLIGKTDLIYPTQFPNWRSPDIFPLFLSTTPLTALNQKRLNFLPISSKLSPRRDLGRYIVTFTGSFEISLLDLCSSPIASPCFLHTSSSILSASGHKFLDSGASL